MPGMFGLDIHPQTKKGAQIKMAAKIEFTAKITTEDGEKEIAFTSSKDIPDFDEFEKAGFSAAFDDLETAVLTARKEAGEAVIAQYLSESSKKNES
jgi:hypothetical protein